MSKNPFKLVLEIVQLAKDKQEHDRFQELKEESKDVVKRIKTPKKRRNYVAESVDEILNNDGER